MYRIGLTGGIGSGKSVVATLLAAHGATVIDADHISRHSTAQGGGAISAIAVEFGAKAIGPDGSMDRAWMRDLVFSDDSAKNRLEGILHPIVRAEIERQLDSAQTRGVACVVIEIPLLLESASAWRARLHRILTVDCSIEEQVLRVSARNKLSQSEVRRIIAVQASREQRLLASDLVIRNEQTSMPILEQQVEQIAKNFGL